MYVHNHDRNKNFGKCNHVTSMFDKIGDLILGID
jgi:hypothetical protein